MGTIHEYDQDKVEGVIFADAADGNKEAHEVLISFWPRGIDDKAARGYKPDQITVSVKVEDGKVVVDYDKELLASNQGGG